MLNDGTQIKSGRSGVADRESPIPSLFPDMFLVVFQPMTGMYQTFFKNSVLRTMLLPLMRQSTSAVSSVSLIFFTTVPLLRTREDPFTLRSLMRVTLSPSFKIAPLLSFVSIKIVFFAKIVDLRKDACDLLTISLFLRLCLKI